MDMEREQTTIRMPGELMERIREAAEQRGISVNAMMIMILNEAQNHHQKESDHVPFPTRRYA